MTTIRHYHVIIPFVLTITRHHYIVSTILIYNDEIDSMNKQAFYPYIGELIKNTLKRQELLFETMLHVVEEIESDWGLK